MQVFARFMGILSAAIVALGSVSAQAEPPPIPELPLWEAQMLQYGQQNCNRLRDGSIPGDKKLSDTYYDGERVFYQMYDYTKNTGWLGCADAAEQVYRGFVHSNSGAVPGFWLFPHGVWTDFKRTGDISSRDALRSLADKAAFSYTPLDWTANANGTEGGSREVAYNLMAKLLAMDAAGYADQGRIDAMVAQAFSHMDQWFVSKNADYIRPFMAALTSEALIMWHKKTADPRVLPIIRTAMDWIWDNMWLPNEESFKYTDRQTSTGGMEPAPDLNLLVAPVYAWLYWQTQDPKYQVRGDAIFAGGVRKGPQYLALGKQFNQNYRWSFEYIYWRKLQESPLFAQYPGTSTVAGPGGGPSGSPQPSSSLAPTDGTSVDSSRNIRHQHGPLRK